MPTNPAQRRLAIVLMLGVPLRLHLHLEVTVLRDHALDQDTRVMIVLMDGFVHLRRPQLNLPLAALAGLVVTAPEDGSVSLNQQKDQKQAQNQTGQLQIALALLLRFSRLGHLLS